MKIFKEMFVNESNSEDRMASRYFGIRNIAQEFNKISELVKMEVEGDWFVFNYEDKYNFLNWNNIKNIITQIAKRFKYEIFWDTKEKAKGRLSVE